MTVKTSTASKAQIAYEFLREGIATGRFAAGYRLVLTSIAAQLDMSVVPVREAIRRLEAEGTVTFQRNVGAQVVMTDEREYLRLMQMLALVEGYGTALSAPLLTAEQLSRARDMNDSLRKSLQHFEPRAYTEHNLQFHAALFESCPNPHILDLVHRAWDRMATVRHSTFSFVPGRARESVAEHSQLLRLIEQGADPEVVEQAARQHRLRTVDALLAHQGAQLSGND